MIIDDGMQEHDRASARRLTTWVMNETTQQRSLTEGDLDRAVACSRACTCWPAQIEIAQVQLLGSGAILGEVQAAHGC
jgi:pyruvate dehydrogenase E1 component